MLNWTNILYDMNDNSLVQLFQYNVCWPEEALHRVKFWDLLQDVVQKTVERDVFSFICFSALLLVAATIVEAAWLIMNNDVNQ